VRSTTADREPAFPSWKRSILTEIYLCHACSYHEIKDGNARAGRRLHRAAGNFRGSTEDCCTQRVT
jgi:hypothetical protein